MKVTRSLWVIFLLINLFCTSQTDYNLKKWDDIVPGNAQYDKFIPLLKNKNVGIVANQSSMVNDRHLVDILVNADIQLKKVFSPEHGFRGKSEAGAMINNETDIKTGLPIISLYGSHKKPTRKDLIGIEIMVFDLQDVGIRFYTYLATMSYVMEACAENGISILILDRPNPNGFYVDGPIMEEEHTSFVGLHPVPIVHGMTAGEYALMVNGEKWLKNGIQCDIKIITVKKYSHKDIVELPIKPSPNLPNINSVLIYPSLCLFEGTIISIGRGTDHPFEVAGHPNYSNKKISFTPESRAESSVNPPFKNKKCYGINLVDFYKSNPEYLGKINLDYLLLFYNNLEAEDKFFNSYFVKLAGTKILQEQIESGKTAWEIKNSWKAGIKKYKKIRAKYLLYPDFD